MAHKTIMIQEEVYEMLNALKGTDKSFNDIIKELIQKNGDLRPYFGIIDDSKAEVMLKAIKNLKSKVSDKSKEVDLVRAWE